MSSRYDDIINLPHHRSKTHPHMTNYDRAAQFSPFAALKGYEEEICEEARYTEGKLALDEVRISAINEALIELKAREKEHPPIHLCFFRADELKEGGAYVNKSARILRIDASAHMLYLDDGTMIAFDDIIDIEI